MFLGNVDAAERHADQLYDGWVAESPKQMLAATAELRVFPDFLQKVFIDRNRAWLPEIVKIARSETPTLIAVGALHLIGEGSVIELLKSHDVSVVHTPRK